jgi:hypothetical protein
MQREDTNTHLLALPLEFTLQAQRKEAFQTVLTIGRPQVRILEALGLFEQLTAEQLARHLNYSFRYTQDKCKALTDAKYLQRLTLPKRTTAGSVPYVYTLARKGRQFLRSFTEEAQPEPVKKRYRPSEERARIHTVAISEVLLQILKAAEMDETLSVVRIVPEREFLNEPIRVSVTAAQGAETVSLIPDLWVHLRQRIGNKSYTYCFCFEVNLTAVEQKRWRRKVALYLSCAEGYKRRLGIDVLQVVTLVGSSSSILRKTTGSETQTELLERQRERAASQKRTQDMLVWTERELGAHNKREESDLFLYSPIPLDMLTPGHFLYSPHFSQPYANETVSLLIAGEEETNG